MGRVIQFVGCDQRAWHAGRSQWCARENCNDYSVGIELEGSDTQPFTAAQYTALWMVIDALRARYPIAAPITGTVTELNVVEGHQVEVGAVLAVVTEEDT